MRLKRVKIFGFKTFADRTEFDLHGNLIAVVGPNGCGKSNLVDAILWGLGEGNARHLRAQNNQDVIFSGSSRRKAVGFAEVTLLFDNEDGALPVASSEVSITRKLNRAGESEYFINRQSCRLRDVFDLLADSGLGRAGYSIVGQKEIDQALAASPEDRRAWVDEAAGVQRYRVRKIESLKRLSAAQSHLERISDILKELEGQREPLRQEAEVAIRYKSLLNSLKEVESGLLIVEVAKAVKDVVELEARIGESLKLAKAENDSADAAEDEAQSISETVRTLDAELDRTRDGRQTASTHSERAEAAIKLAEQKIQTLKDLESNLGEEAEVAKQRIVEARAELQDARANAESEKEALDKVRVDTSGAGEEAKALAQQLKSLERDLAAARDLHNRSLKQQAQRAHYDERKKAVKREIAGIDGSLPDLGQAVEESQSSLQEVAGRHNEAETALEQLQEELSAIDKQEADEASENRKRLGEKAALEGRKQGIEATIDTHEGLSQGAKAVLDAKAKGILKGNYIAVGEALEVHKKHALAIETALGGAVHDLIVEHESDAKAAIEHLKQHRLGRATFQPLPLMRPHEPSAELKRLLNQAGIVARASELVHCKPEHRPVFESILGRVVIVQDLDVAFRLAKTSGWSRLVTLEGEVVHSGGAVTGGQAGKGGYGLVQRKADLVQVIEQIEALEKQIKAAQGAAAKWTEAREKLRTAQESQRAQIKALHQELADARQFAHSVQHELQSTERSKEKLETELENLLKATFEEIEVPDLEAIEAQRDALVKAMAVKSADAESAAERLREAQARVQQAQTQCEIAERRLHAAEENERMRERKLTNLGPERERAAAEIAHAKEELQKANAAKSKAEAELHQLQEERSALIQKASTLREQARSARSHAQTCTETAHQAEVSRARIETRRAASAQRLLEEYGVSEDDALVQAASIELPADAVTVVNRLRREIKAMGDVNVGAVEAFERLTERWDELTNQQEDIVGGIRQVEASIRELDKLTRERFVNTFEQLQVAFSEMFQKLFGGGEGRIYLTDEENILESGVEIDVMLPGKKRQRLELLSGGERSLCAASFLFALLKVKPSPLVILDEVDAPLDGRNVERFIETLHEFSAISQFILITHNPTTIESAPIWLGVTMQEPGVSTLAPMRFAPIEPAQAVVQVFEPVLTPT